MNKWILTLSILAGVFAQAGELTVQAEPSSSFLLPIARSTCGQLDAGKVAPPLLAPNSFEINSLALRWKSKNPMQVGFMTLTFKSDVLEGGRYQCAIAPDEVESVFSAFGHVIGAGDHTIYSSGFCGLRCGAVKIIPEVKSATLTGTLKVTGYEMNDKGRFTPVTAETPVSLEYSKW
jgi:hypothetical protein